MIYIQAGDLWSYFVQNKATLEDTMHLVATDEGSGIEIYLTEDGEYPYFVVELNDTIEYEEDTVSQTDAENTYQRILRFYLPDDDDYPFDESDLERMDEIHEAAIEFLTVLLECDPEEACIDETDIENFVSYSEEYLAEVHGFSVRHPIYDDGKIIQFPFSGE